MALAYYCRLDDMINDVSTGSFPVHNFEFEKIKIYEIAKYLTHKRAKTHS
jgi:hypothetical protein